MIFVVVAWLLFGALDLLSTELQLQAKGESLDGILENLDVPKSLLCMVWILSGPVLLIYYLLEKDE